MLYALELNKECLISDCLNWGDLPFSWVWRWRHPLRGRERGEVKSLLLLLQNFKPDKKHVDKWWWERTSSSKFEAKELSIKLDEFWAKSGDPATFWSKLLPKKVNVFVEAAAEFSTVFYAVGNQRG